jgi:hypothetical protein
MSQIQTKWINNNAVTDEKIRLRNNENLRGRNAANTADISILKVRTDNELEVGALSHYPYTATNANHLVSWGQVQSAVAGLRDPKDAVRVASTGSNIALTGGASLTIDSVSLINGDRALLRHQTAPEDNGIYVVSGIGSAYVLTRSSDADEDVEVTQGMSTIVAEGAINGNRQYVLSTPDPIVLNTTSLTFVEIPNPAIQYINGKEAIALTGTDISNGYVDLAQEAAPNSVNVHPVGGLMGVQGTHYTLSVVGLVTRVTFAGSWITLLESGDVLSFQYEYEA